jgi:hypothetical protein
MCLGLPFEGKEPARIDPNTPLRGGATSRTGPRGGDRLPCFGCPPPFPMIEGSFGATLKTGSEADDATDSVTAEDQQGAGLPWPPQFRGF